MAIRIVSKVDGFRRCGVEHPDTPTIYPDDQFTKEELARLESEPMLIVDKVPDSKAKETKKGDS